jgi:two-component system, OmpR family, KDP operon response regulator KdpE
MSDQRRVVVCDDDPHILRALKVVLGQRGFDVVPSTCAAEALDLLSVHPPDAAIVDLVLPDGDGVQICMSIREWSKMPIILLSAVEEEAEKVKALNAGADDYITKPFSPEELIARLNAVLRRTEPDEEEPSVTADGLGVDLAARAVRRDGELVHLTPTQFALLRVLVRNRGRLMTHRMLLLEVWGPACEDETQLLRVHVANLRRKIEPDPADPRYITTDPGVGYRFAA